MKSPSLIALTILTLALASLAQADPPERFEKIRREFRGDETPDYHMFAFQARSMRESAEWNRGLTLQHIKKNMNLDSTEAAENFLSRMLKAASELDAAEDEIWGTLICNPAAPRDKQGLYSRLDQLEDLREVKSHNVYTKFISRLDANQQDALTAWLAEEKEGFYSRTAEHESMFEGVNVDVVTHVDAVCAEQAKK